MPVWSWYNFSFLINSLNHFFPLTALHCLCKAHVMPLRIMDKYKNTSGKQLVGLNITSTTRIKTKLTTQLYSVKPCFVESYNMIQCNLFKIYNYRCPDLSLQGLMMEDVILAKKIRIWIQITE